MSQTIRMLSSMATRQLLADLAERAMADTGVSIMAQAGGGVDVARRVREGEACDIVVLASDAIERLIDEGLLEQNTRSDLVRSEVAIAVRAGDPHPAVGTEHELRQAVLNAASIAWSTGPSGVYLGQLLERWGIKDALAGRIHQAPPGVPVASLLAKGQATLGFQQLSEMIDAPGIDVLGTLPPAIAHITVFSAAIHVRSASGEAARAVLASFAAADQQSLIRRHGMQPA